MATYNPNDYSTQPVRPAAQQPQTISYNMQRGAANSRPTGAMQQNPNRSQVMPSAMGQARPYSAVAQPGPQQYQAASANRPTVQQQYNQNVGQDMYAMNPQQPGPQQYNTGQAQARGGGQQPGRPYQPDPLPGTEQSKNPSQYYNPTMPAQPTYNPAQPAQANQFSYYQGLDPTTLQSNDEREAALQAVQANVPIWQLGQNAYQYSQDFNEANRRYDQQFQYQSGLDQFNMGLSSQQQAMAEWQAQQQANQWAQDYSRQTGLDAWNQDFSQQQFGLQDYATRQGLVQSGQQIANTQAYQQGQLGNEAQQIAQTGQYQQGQLANQRTELQNTAAYQQGQLGIQQAANEITRAYNEGRLSNEQAQLQLAQLTQQQTYGIQSGQLSTQQQELARRYGLDVTTQEQLNAYRNAQLSQEAALQAQQLAANERIATMQTYGRAVRPNVRFLRAT